MRSVSHAKNEKENRYYEGEFAKTNRANEHGRSQSSYTFAQSLTKSVARKALNSRITKTKELATDIGVSERTVQYWASGERSFSEEQGIDILVKVKGYFLDENGLQIEIDRILMEQTGNNLRLCSNF